jgi:transcriptional regulator with XRE-family HTH domain
MNIEIANHLIELRKKNGLSQEALADRLGLSRQAVSKWERAEASPDTDNLIALAKLYGISLDELLLMGEQNSSDDARSTSENGAGESYEKSSGGDQARADIPHNDTDCKNTAGTDTSNIYTDCKDESNGCDDTSEADDNNSCGDGADASGQTHSGKNQGAEYVHIGLDGIHVKDSKNEVHIGKGGIHVTESKGNDVHIGHGGVYVNGEKYDHNFKSAWHRFPFALIVVIAFLLLGLLKGMWHPAWMLFLTIPVYHSLVDAVIHRSAHRFAYPVLAVLIFLSCGFFAGGWYWAWIVFLTIPIYYVIFPTRHDKADNHSDNPSGRIFTRGDE